MPWAVFIITLCSFLSEPPQPSPQNPKSPTWSFEEAAAHSTWYRCHTLKQCRNLSLCQTSPGSAGTQITLEQAVKSGKIRVSQEQGQFQSKSSHSDLGHLPEWASWVDEPSDLWGTSWTSKMTDPDGWPQPQGRATRLGHPRGAPGPPPPPTVGTAGPGCRPPCQLNTVPRGLSQCLRGPGTLRGFLRRALADLPWGNYRAAPGTLPLNSFAFSGSCTFYHFLFFSASQKIPP